MNFSFSTFISLKRLLDNKSHFSIEHCVKSVQIRIFFRYIFSCVQSKYRKLLTKKFIPAISLKDVLFLLFRSKNVPKMKTLATITGYAYLICLIFQTSLRIFPAKYNFETTIIWCSIFFRSSSCHFKGSFFKICTNIQLMLK